MRTRLAIVLALALCLGPVPGRAAETFTDADVYANVSADEVVLGNALVERRWTLDAFSTQAIVDKRDGRSFGAHPDFSILLDGASITSDRFSTAAVDVAALDRGGLGVTFTLTLAGLVTVERVVEAYPGVAGFSSRMTVSSPLPLVFSGYTLDEVAAGPEYAATVHAFRAGADWREEGWKPFAIGDPHLGDWRVEATAATGRAAGSARRMAVARRSGGSAGVHGDGATRLRVLTHVLRRRGRRARSSTYRATSSTSARSRRARMSRTRPRCRRATG